MRWCVGSTGLDGQPPSSADIHRGNCVRQGVDTHERHFISASEAARILGKHPSTIRRWVRNGQLPAVQIPHAKKTTVLLDVDALEQLVKATRTQVPGSPGAPGRLSWIPDWVKEDQAFGPALLVLDDPVFRGRTRRAVDIEGRKINWRRLELTCDTPEQRELLAVARDLWDRRSRLSYFADLAKGLDDPQLRRVLTALELSRAWLSFDEAVARTGRT